MNHFTRHTEFKLTHAMILASLIAFSGTMIVDRCLEKQPVDPKNEENAGPQFNP
jgi:hypothetical protein